MKTNLPTQNALVSILPCKKFDFLYNIKKVNSDEWLPRIHKSLFKDSIPSTGLYTIIYKLYKNKEGFDAIYICKVEKVVTK